MDVELIKQAAASRWPEIFQSLAGTDAGLFDGQHHPCPRCGGRDRFRGFTDGSGGAICNQCLRSQNGDGLAVLQWLTGEDFLTATKRVANYLGIKDTGGNGRGRKKSDPAEHLEFLDWGDFLVQLWCSKKPPITPAAVQAIGGRRARYRRDYLVIAIPIWGRQLQAAEPVGWILYNTTGQTLPKFKPKVEGKSQPPEWVKVKVTHGSAPGLVGQVDRLADAKTAWKLEGSTDVLAAVSLSPPADVAVISNAYGCGEEPLPWMVELMAGKQVRVLHDADRPGQDGAMWMGEGDRRRPGWVPHLAAKAAEVRNVQLPYPVTPDGGQDVRDWTREASRTWSDLEQLADVAEPYQITSDDAAALETKPLEAPDDPTRLAKLNLERYATRHDGATLRYWRQEWYAWKRDRYRKIDPDELRAKVWGAVKQEFDQLNLEEQQDPDREGKPKPARKVSRTLVNNVLGATESLTFVPNHLEQGTWIDDEAGIRERRTYLAMRNGILDIEGLLAGEHDILLPHSPRWWSTVCLDYDFDPHATCPEWLRMLGQNLEGDQERLAIVQEWAGYLLTPDTSQQKFVVCEGEGANGKSAFFAGIQAMLGDAHCSFVPLELFGERFTKTQTLGKLVNIAADCGELDRVAEGFIKSFTSGDVMFFDRKGIAGLNAIPTARLMVGTNTRPRISDRSTGIWRRMILIPWRVQIPEERQIRGMDKADYWRRSGELPGILRWAIQGLYRLRQNGRFTRSELCQRALDDYRDESNPARSFLTENYVEEPSGAEWVDDVYKAYRRWCDENGHRPLSSRSFGWEVKRAFKSVEKRRKRGHGEFGGRLAYAYQGIARNYGENSEF